MTDVQAVPRAGIEVSLEHDGACVCLKPRNAHCRPRGEPLKLWAGVLLRDLPIDALWHRGQLTRAHAGPKKVSRLESECKTHTGTQECTVADKNWQSAAGRHPYHPV